MPGQVRNADLEPKAAASGSASRGPGPEAKDTSQITVADALRLPSIPARPARGAQRRRPRQPIRSVHVTEDPKVSATLKGGELILSTGMVLNDKQAEPRRS